MNTILLFLSDHKEKDNYGNKIEQQLYSCENGRKYSGTQTNDAPLRCLFDLVSESEDGGQSVDHHWIDQILAICSDRVLHFRTGEANKTTFEYFEDLVHDLQREYEYYPDHTVNIRIIKYDENQHENPDDRAARIYQEISGCLNPEGQSVPAEQNIYIDYTGGLRDISFLMTTIVRYLEVAGIHCRKIIYSDFHTHEIKNINYIYKMFQQINAVNAFLATGNAEELRDLYQDSSDEVKNIISAIQKVSDTVLMCDVGHIDEALDALSRAIPENLEQDDLSSALFNSLLPIIKRKMHLTGTRMEYPDLISWCLDNRMVQQAVTFYVEKMPVYYFEKKMIPSDITLNPAATSGSRSSSSLEADAFYTQLYHDPTAVTKEDPRVSQLADILDQINNKVGSGSGPLFAAVSNEIKSQQARHPGFRCALGKILADINKCYKKEDGKYKNVRHDHFKTMPKLVTGFINSAKSDNYYLMYCITGRYPEKSAEKERTTYRNKINTLRKLHQGDLHFKDHQEVIYKMDYYLAVKIIRNHMNHAAGGEKNKTDISEPEAIRYLNEELGIHFDANPTIDQVITILRNGIALGEKSPTSE